MNNPAIPGAEFLPLDEIRALQRERWSRQREYLQACSIFYRDNFADLPRSLDAFTDFPLTDKQMLRDDQARHPPFGSYLASSADEIRRVHRTSGTTGVAMNLALSHADAEMTASVAARAQSAAGLGPGYRVVHCLSLPFHFPRAARQ